MLHFTSSNHQPTKNYTLKRSSLYLWLGLALLTFWDFGVFLNSERICRPSRKKRVRQKGKGLQPTSQGKGWSGTSQGNSWVAFRSENIRPNNGLVALNREKAKHPLHRNGVLYAVESVCTIITKIIPKNDFSKSKKFFQRY